MKEIELSNGEVLELQDSLNPYEVRDIRDEIIVSGNNEMQNLGSMMFKIAEVVLKDSDESIKELSQEDIDKIANEYVEEVRGFQPQS